MIRRGGLGIGQPITVFESPLGSLHYNRSDLLYWGRGAARQAAKVVIIPTSLNNSMSVSSYVRIGKALPIHGTCIDCRACEWSKCYY